MTDDNQLPTGSLPLPPDHQLALVFGETDIRLMRLDDAQVLYAELDQKKTLGEVELTDEEKRVYAALVVALGTLPDERRIDKAPEV